MPLDRRGFLGALALAPAAVAACSTPAAARKAAARDAAAPAAVPPPPASPPPAPPGLEAVREHPLPRAAEPAFTFSAAAVRPGEP
jgi:hypothetical protein